MLKTFLFLGISGCGKGTQAAFAADYLKENSPEIPIRRLEMGGLFREVWGKEGNYSYERSKAIMEKGLLQPSFMQVMLWSGFFLDEMKGTEHLIIDGAPRRLLDAELMHGAFGYYKRENPVIFFIDIDRETAKKRIKARSIEQDRIEDSYEHLVEQRLQWFEEEARPALMYFRDREGYTFVRIDGNGTREEVWSQIKPYLI